MRRRGFTLIEMLVVVVVIAILAGVLLPAMSVIRKKRSQTSTYKQLNNLGNAISRYMDNEGMLPVDDNDPDLDFRSKPLKFLMLEPRTAGKEPYFELTTGNGLKHDGTQWILAKPFNAEAMTDHFAPGKPDNRLQLTIVNKPDTTPRYTETIVIRAPAQDLEPDDDIVYFYTVDPDAVRADPAAYGLENRDLDQVSSRTWVFLERDE